MRYKTHKQDIVRKSLKNSFLIFLNIYFSNKKELYYYFYLYSLLSIFNISKCNARILNM